MRQTRPFDLTESECTVLRHFIEKESAELEEVQRGKSSKSDTVQAEYLLRPTKKKPYYKPHPAQLSREVKISRRWAKTICEKFTSELNIFESKEEFTPNQNQPTLHYCLKYGYPAFRKIVKIVVTSFEPRERIELLDCAFLNQNIDESLVKKILAEKKVMICRQIDILDWEEKEASAFFHEVFEDRSQFYREIQQEELAEFYSVSSFQEYVRKAALPSDRGCRRGPISTLRLRFPVFPDPYKRDVNIPAVIKNHDFSLDTLPDLHKYSSAIEEYYRIHEHEDVVLPLLALILTSPIALDEFVNGDWDPYKDNPSPGYTRDELDLLKFPFLFEMIFTTINDIIKTRATPEKGLLSEVWVRPYECPMEKNDCLLKIRLKNGYVLNYDARFNTTYDKSNESQPREKNQYRINIWTTIQPFGAIKGVIRDTLKDPNALVKGLKDDDNPVSRYLKRKFSYKIQNILKYYAPDEDISDYHLELLLQELNRTLIQGPFQDEPAFQELLQKEDQYHYLRPTTALYDHLRWPDFDEMTWQNRVLIERAYPEAFKLNTLAEILESVKN